MRVLFWFLKQVNAHISESRNSVKIKRAKLIKIEAPLLDEISGLAIIKLLDKSTQSIIMLKVKFM